MVAPYVFQFKPKTKYTLSFYAKSEQNGLPVTAMLTSKVWGKWIGDFSFPLTKEWKRYSVSFAPSESLGQFYFGVPWWEKDTLLSVKAPKVNFWIDDIRMYGINRDNLK